jgi:hypothetical protein
MLMCVWVHTHTHAKHTHTQTQTHNTYIHTYIHTYTYTHTYTHIHTHVQVSQLKALLPLACGTILILTEQLLYLRNNTYTNAGLTTQGVMM